MDGMEKFFEEFHSRYHSFLDLSIFTFTQNSEEHSEIVFAVDWIIDSFKKCDIPIEEDSSKTDRRSVMAFKYLILNTDFKCRSHFVKDSINATMIGRCVPQMSPYVLILTLLELEYENIFAESLLHLPLDLCVELLEAMKDCICKMPFQRRLNFLICAITNSHKKLMLVAKISSQSIKYNESLELLFLLVQQFIALLMSSTFLSLDDLNNSRKNERLGLVLKSVIALTKTCIANGLEDITPIPEIAKMYSINFSEEAAHRCNDNLVRQMRMLDQEFVHILMRKVKAIDIDSETYKLWATLESPENPSMSLQRSIRNDLYHLIEFMKRCNHLMCQKHLVESLKKFKSKPATIEILSGLDFGELRSGTQEKKKECIKKIMLRYTEWSHEIIDIIRNNRDLLDSDDVASLFNYLEFILKKPGQHDHKIRVSRTIRTILHERSSRKYVCRPKMLDALGSSYSVENFMKFVHDNQNITTSDTLRTTLLYVLYNPREITSTLVSIAIGCYENLTLSPDDLVLLYYAIDINKNYSPLERCISSIRSSKWNEDKLITLVDVLLKEFMLTADDFVNEFLNPWLTYPLPTFSKIMPMMKFCQSSLIPRSTKETDVPAVICAFAHALSSIRRTDDCISRRSLDEVLEEIKTTVEFFLRMYSNDHTAQEPDDIATTKWVLLPIDRYKPPFSGLYGARCRYRDKSVSDMILLWAKDCWEGLDFIKFKEEVIEDHPDAPDNAADFVCFNDDFIRYLFINCTQSEYVDMAWDVVTDGDCYDDYENFEMCDKSVRITVEAALYFLESPADNHPESFACSMLNLAKLMNEIIEDSLINFNDDYYGAGYKELRRVYKFYESLRKNLKMLEVSIKHTKFSSLFSSINTLINDPNLDDAPREVAFYLLTNAVESFGNECLKIPHEEIQFDYECSPITGRFKVFLHFFNECIIGDPADDEVDVYKSLCETFKTLRNTD